MIDDDALREEIEREMRTAARLFDASGETMLQSTAISIALALVRKERALYESAEASAARNSREREQERGHAEAAEKRWNEHYTDCHMNSNRVLREAAEAAFRQATKDREAAEAGREAAEKEHDEWRGRALALDKDVEALIQERGEARRALAEFREKWGHIEQCGCFFGHRDPHCAPQEEKVGE